MLCRTALQPSDVPVRVSIPQPLLFPGKGIHLSGHQETDSHLFIAARIRIISHPHGKPARAGVRHIRHLIQGFHETGSVNTDFKPYPDLSVAAGKEDCRTIRFSFPAEGIRFPRGKGQPCQMQVRPACQYQLLLHISCGNQSRFR